MTRCTVIVLMLLTVFNPASAGDEPATAKAMHVVLVSVDGLAASYLDDPRAELPTLRMLAKRGASARGMITAFPSVTWPAHVTLVFPFDSADPDWFAGHMASIAAVTAPIAVAFDRLARIDNPHQPKYRHLNVLLADAASAVPLTDLYRALGGKGDFEPHVTLTRFGAVFSAKAFERQMGERQMGALGRPVRGRISALELLSLSHGAIRREQAWDLAG